MQQRVNRIQKKITTVYVDSTTDRQTSGGCLHTYTVTCYNGEGIACTCPGFHYVSRCKHLNIATECQDETVVTTPFRRVAQAA